MDFRRKLKYLLSKSVQWEPSCSMQTDRHNEASNRFSQLCEKPKAILISVYKTPRAAWDKEALLYSLDSWLWEIFLYYIDCCALWRIDLLPIGTSGLENQSDSAVLLTSITSVSWSTIKEATLSLTPFLSLCHTDKAGTIAFLYAHLPLPLIIRSKWLKSTEK